MSLYDRVVRVDVQPRGGTGISIEDLRVSFDVTKTHTEATNTATIEVYNLSREHRGQLSGKHADVRLYAGYREDAGAALIFVGESGLVHSKMETTNAITVIEAQDGIKELREFRVSLSYKPGASVLQVLQGCASKIGLPLRASIEVTGVYPRGFSYLGPVKEALDMACRRGNVRWSIQDAGLLILPKDKPSYSLGLMLSPETGMIGSPERITYTEGDLDGDEESRPEWKVTSLLQPLVLPTHQVQVRSNLLSGTFLVETVHHVGDTHGPEFITELELK